MKATQTANLLPGNPGPCPPVTFNERVPTTGTEPVGPVPERPRPACAFRRRVAWALALSPVLFIVTYTGARWWFHAQAWAKTDNAYISAHVHTVSARVPGTVQEVFVDEHQEVSRGTLLARLDPRDFQVRRDQAQAQVAQAQAKLQVARAELAQTQAQVEREKARATRAERDLQRANTLAEGTGAAISRQEFDTAKSEAEAAAAALAAAESAIESARAAVLAATAQEQGARAALADADLQLSYCEIRAPEAGRIGKKNLETGNRVQPGQALLAIVQKEIWVTANYKETQLARMQPGQPVRIWLDVFPGKVFTGRVASLSPASGAQFALLPPDNATGNFTRIVQRVPVKIVLDPNALAACGGRIVPGMSAVVEVKVGA